MARNESLEDEIRLRPGERAAYLIYADWLQQKGDPRGELIVVQLALREEADPDRRRALISEQDALFTLWHPELLGTLPGVGPMVWRNGFVDRLTLLPGVPIETVRDALDHPSACLLRSIDVSLRPRDEGELRSVVQDRGVALTREVAIPEDPVFDGTLVVTDRSSHYELTATFNPDQPSWLSCTPGYEFLLGTRVGTTIHVFGCDDRTGPSDLGQGPVRTERFTIPPPESELEVAFALILSLYHHEHRETVLRFTGGGLIPARPGVYPVQLRQTASIDDPALQDCPEFTPVRRRGRALRRPPEAPAWFDSRGPLESQYVERSGRWMVWTTWQLVQGRRTLELSAIDLERKRVAHRWMLDPDGTVRDRATLYCGERTAWALYGGRVYGFDLRSGEPGVPWTLPTPELSRRHRGFHPVAFHPRAGRAAWMIELCDGLRKRFPCLIGWVNRDGSTGQVLVADCSPTGAHAATPLRPTLAVLQDGRILALGHQWLWLVEPEQRRAGRLAEAWDYDQVRVTRHVSGYRVWTRGPEPAFVEFA